MAATGQTKTETPAFGPKTACAARPLEPGVEQSNGRCASALSHPARIAEKRAQVCSGPSSSTQEHSRDSQRTHHKSERADAHRPYLLYTWLQRDELRTQFLAQMRVFSVLVCPVAAIPAFRHGERSWQVEGQEVKYLDAWSTPSGSICSDFRRASCQ